ncbi:MAG TPA: tetratricopeptide repeat protein [Candidatus Polarisedimenticolaceae bacterium]|nr:tetratricopeptide repeat protein [Candidatus Polarisedimenticolaceae bacterium]
MDAERLRRTDALLAAALDLPESERTAFLLKACGGDLALLQAVTRLLRDAERPDDDFLRPGEVLEGPLWERASAELDGPRVAAGAVFGSWEVVKALGAGGMAEVFLAKRIAGDFEQLAAIKLIKRGVDTDEIVHRFRQERQILASLDHPNIARLLDGGVTPDGRPYFVMEWIDGQPIDERCNRDAASIELRLRRFLDVCRAVEHAHRKLVVHRDLKPSNVLIDAAGRVKLLDFGIAKLLDPGESAAAPATRTAMRVMTPEYASPEQVRGEPATTAGDVYQLGLVLYELLTGQRAHDLRDASFTEIERVVCQQVPPRPSTAVGRPDRSAKTFAAPPRLKHRLRGDLDNIVLKALRKEPDARYPTAAALADDLERHLSGRPVAARAPTLAYRAGRFVRRHKVGVAAAVLVVCALLAGLGATLWQARIARREAATARSVSDFLIETFHVADPSEARGSSVTARELLDSATLRLAQLGDQPDVQATMQDVIGRVYLSLGLYEPSRKLLGEALATRQARASGPDALVAESLDHLGQVLKEKGEYGESEKNLRAALDMRRELFGGSHTEVADSLRNLSLLAQIRDDLKGAASLIEEALGIQRALLGERHPTVAKLMKDLAMVRLQSGDADAAATSLEEALRIQRSTLPEDHPDVADTLNALGMVEQNRNRLDASEAAYRECLAIRTKVLGPRHAHTATARNNLAGLLYQQRDFAAAAPMFRENLDQQRETLGPDHPSVATSMTNLGVLLVTMKDLDGAEPLYREALRIRTATYGDHHHTVATTRYYLARLLRDRGDVGQAEALMRQSMPDIPETNSNLASLRLDLGEILLVQGRFDEAEPLLEDAVRLHTKVDGPEHWRTAAARSGRGAWRARTGDFRGAEEDLQAAWAVLQKRPEDDPRRQTARDRLAEIYRRTGRENEAVALR